MALVVLSVLAPVLPFERGQNLYRIRRAPGWPNLLGTDNRGVDMLVGVIDGARTSLLVGVLGALIGVTVGGVVGLVVGYRRGVYDRVGLVVLDVFAAFPAYIAAVTATLLFERSVRTIVLILGVLSIPTFARVARATTLPFADRDFVLAARMAGARHRRVMWRDLLPNVAVPIVSYSLVAVGVIVSVEGALSFIGSGVPEGVQSWGKMIAAGQERVRESPHLTLVPAAVLLVTVLALNTVAERCNQRWLFGGPAPRPVGSPRRRPRRERAGTPPTDVRGERRGLVVDDLHTWIDSPFGPVRAVNGVSLELRPGEMTALVGESGSGKTMLGRSLLGLIGAPLVPGLPGRLQLGDVDLRSLDDRGLDRIRGRRVAMVLQDPMTSLDPVQRIGRQITEPVRVHLGIGRAEAREHAVRLLESVGVPDARRRLRSYPHELSGGLRQRVAIAIALSCDPDVLIADEPTSALDVTVQAQLLDLLDELRRERRVAVLLITHDLGIVAGRADQVLVMYAGRIVERGSAQDVLARPRMPYTRALLDAVPRADAPSHRRLAAIAGAPPVLVGDPPGCAFAPRCGLANDHCRIERPPLEPGPDGSGRAAACWRPID